MTNAQAALIAAAITVGRKALSFDSDTVLELASKYLANLNTADEKMRP